MVAALAEQRGRIAEALGDAVGRDTESNNRLGRFDGRADRRRGLLSQALMRRMVPSGATKTGKVQRAKNECGRRTSGSSINPKTNRAPSSNSRSLYVMTNASRWVRLASSLMAARWGSPAINESNRLV